MHVSDCLLCRTRQHILIVYKAAPIDVIVLQCMHPSLSRDGTESALELDPCTTIVTAVAALLTTGPGVPVFKLMRPMSSEVSMYAAAPSPYY